MNRAPNTKSGFDVEMVGEVVGIEMFMPTDTSVNVGFSRVPIAQLHRASAS